jgi:hypothetical protein
LVGLGTSRDVLIPEPRRVLIFFISYY